MIKHILLLPHGFFRSAIAIALLTALLHAPAAAGVFGTNGFLAFDFINGQSAENNQVNVSNLVITGSSSVIADFSQKDKDDADLLAPFDFRELKSLTFGSQITFDFTLNTIVLDTAPDAFSLSLLDSAGNSLVDTDDGTALFSVSLKTIGNPAVGDLAVFNRIGGDSDIRWSVAVDANNVYQVTIFTGAAPNNGVIPEPNSLAVFSAIAGFGLLVRRRRC